MKLSYTRWLMVSYLSSLIRLSRVILRPFQITATLKGTSLGISEYHLYGSSRIGVRTPEAEMIGAQLPDDQGLFEIVRGMKRYELTNHLGNVLSVITDTKQAVYDNPPTVLSYYQSTVISYTDYYPFGAPMDHGNSPNDRSWVSLRSSTSFLQ